MLERHADGGTSPAGRTAADRVDHHHHGAASRRQNPVNIGGSACFFDAETRQVSPHGGKKLFRIGHILTVPEPGWPQSWSRFLRRLRDLTRGSGYFCEGTLRRADV